MPPKTIWQSSHQLFESIMVPHRSNYLPRREKNFRLKIFADAKFPHVHELCRYNERMRQGTCPNTGRVAQMTIRGTVRGFGYRRPAQPGGPRSTNV
jgi:hypothetical protein